MNIFTSVLSTLLLMLSIPFTELSNSIVTQKVSNTSVRMIKQTADSSVVVVTWTQSNSDTVRVAWTYPGASITRVATGTRRADTLRVSRGTVVQQATVTLTPKRGALAGIQRSASISIPAKPIPVIQPSIDSIQIDTLVTVPPVVVPPTPPVVVPPVTPVVPTVFTPNIPTAAGLRLIVDARFSGMIQNQLNAQGFGYYWDGRNAVDATAPYGSDVFETFYPGNDLGNGVGGARIYGFEGNRWSKIYFSMMVWVPANYSIHSLSEKFFYPLIGTNGTHTGASPVNWASMSGNPSGPDFGFVMVRRPNGPGEPQNRSAMVLKGKWSIIEMYMQMNTPNVANGVWKVWVDGAIAADDATVIYTSNTTPSYFEGINFDGTRGGGASTTPTPPGGQVRRYNRLAFYAIE